MNDPVDDLSAPVDLPPSEESIAKEVQDLVGGISERFVPRPSNEARTNDVILGIGIFKTRCSWAEFFRNRNRDRFDIEQKRWAMFFSLPENRALL